MQASQVRASFQIAALLLSISFFVGCSADEEANARPAGPPPMPVHTERVSPRALPQTISSVGGLESPEMTTVSSEIAGTVVELNLPEGENVETGHIVLRLDDTEARASVKVTRARLSNARSRLARMEQLSKKGVASQQQLDDASSSFDAADGAHREAKTRLAKHVMRAPYSGTLGMRQIDLGDYVEPGDAVVEISDTTALELRFSLAQRFVTQVQKGQAVLGIVGRCGPRFEGVVVAVDPRVDPRTRMVRVRAAVSNDAEALRPGMAVRVRLVVGMLPDALVVPQEAIVRQGTKHLIFIVDDDGKAQTREVSVGEYFVDGAHITKGLEDGENIVLAGQQKLRPGSLVAPLPHEKSTNPNVDVGRYGPVGCDES